MAERKIQVIRCRCGATAALVIRSASRELAVYRCRRGNWFCRPSEKVECPSISPCGSVEDLGLVLATAQSLE
jgi:hypothetical protein